MSMLIQHNMMAWNAERQFNTVTKAKNKKAEKLSSGYRINRAADDAAGAVYFGENAQADQGT